MAHKQAPGPVLSVLRPGDPFPPLSHAWGPGTEAPGLLAAGGRLDAASLIDAYRQGVFPWFSQGQPILWWSPDPRMVLKAEDLRLHPSMAKTLKRLLRQQLLEIRIDHDFSSVIEHCAHAPRGGQGGTWIVPAMIDAYTALHRVGCAHSVEAWVAGRLAGGLYCVNLGRMVFGESMFALERDGSKLALLALVAFCRSQGVAWIDCQQNTRHLASLGAREVPRSTFVEHLASTCAQPAPAWRFDPVYWNQISGMPAGALPP